jgi:hypothetical protein
MKPHTPALPVEGDDSDPRTIILTVDELLALANGAIQHGETRVMLDANARHLVKSADERRVAEEAHGDALDASYIYGFTAAKEIFSGDDERLRVAEERIAALEVALLNAIGRSDPFDFGCPCCDYYPGGAPHATECIANKVWTMHVTVLEKPNAE